MGPETQERLKTRERYRSYRIILIIIVIEMTKAALGDGTEEQKMRTKSWGNAFKEWAKDREGDGKRLTQKWWCKFHKDRSGFVLVTWYKEFKSDARQRQHWAG